MPRHPMHMSDAAEAALRTALHRLRVELRVPAAFPPNVLEAAEAAVRAPRLPDEDATDLPFFTIDPPTSKDLDQAMHLERRPGGGYRVHYAIADVAAFVTPGGALDAEAHERVETVYFPDGKVSLHPPVISEGAASLLPDRTVPALVWRHDLDADGEVTRSDVRRALVRSQAKLDYAGVQQDLDAGTAEESVALLREIGKLREAVEIKRGGISVNLPDQEISLEDGAFRLSYRAALPVEGWNEQMSLMTGMAAARIMLDSGTGVLRTQREAEPKVVTRVRAIAQLLAIDWQPHVSYADLVRSLDPNNQKHAAFLSEATAMLLKAEYTPFRDHHLPDPEHRIHAAIAAPYTHCTAPLRRLIDRYTGELCVAASTGQAPPDWVLTALYGLPCDMARGKGSRADRSAVDLAEAAVLMHRVGEVFEASVIDTDKERGKPREGRLHLTDPAVMAKVEAKTEDLKLGQTVRATLERAAPGHTEDDKVLFSLP
ncbi:ribonuclease catalytic domain-containing protein [Streptomyces sp. NPDC048603]|uniref:ribonuclease catalytic domain-containing protein n=1 Tax=Streptomyces sp. NPDC048603 TaxID=3365577 RepID=UPI00371B8B99